MRKRKLTAANLQKRDDGAFFERLYDLENLKQKKLEYGRSSPYRHVYIDPACDEDRLRKVLQELETHLTLSFKETDLFKVLQSVDIASITAESGDVTCENLMALRDDLYSEKFRKSIQTITGCPPLDSRVDCSCNVYPPGGHLLCHDDVIGTSCISYIIYLSEPGEAWKPEDGGALELYPTTTTAPQLPKAVPSKNILPKWNTMVIFSIEPGKSFHAVQEVYAKHKARVSISGWYHVADKTTFSTENASAQTLLNGSYVFTEQRPNDTVVDIIQPELVSRSASKKTFSENDRRYLAEWINEEYLDHAGMARMRQQYVTEGNMLLQQFLKSKVADEAKTWLISEPKEHDFHKPCLRKNINYSLALCGPPHVRRFIRYKYKHDAGYFHDVNDFPGFLHYIRTRVFNSESFGRWLAEIVGCDLDITDEQIRCFRPGLDYTVAVQQPTTGQSRASMILCFVDDFDVQKKQIWSDGEVGGYVCHLKSASFNDAKTPAEVYKNEDEEKVVSIDAEFNTLSLIKQEYKDFNFVKFISKAAPSCRWDIVFDALLK